jgi:hypothetical protein
MGARWDDAPAIRPPAMLETAGHGCTAGLVLLLLAILATLAGLL